MDAATRTRSLSCHVRPAMTDASEPLPARPHAALVWLAALATGAVLWWLACWIVPPAAAPFAGHGERFAEMAADPLAFDGEFPQRLLWPLLAWLAGFVGVSVVAFSHATSALLLAVVGWFVWRRTGRYLDALLVAAAVATSGAVLVYQQMPCFSDQLTLASFLLLVHFRDRPVVFWPLVLLSALSHELVFFFWPWLVYLRCRNGGTWWREGLLLAATLAAYLAFRAPLSGNYDSSYYLDKAFWLPWLLPALWSVWALVTLVEFGPLLVAVAWGTGRDGALARRDGLGGRWGAWLYLAGALLLMVLAYDVMRWATFAMLPLVLAATALVGARGGRLVLAALVAAAPFCYRWLHPIPSHVGGRHFTEVAGTIGELVIAPVHADGGKRVGLADAFDMSWQLLTRWPWLAAATLGALVGIFALGRLLRRGVPARPEREATRPLGSGAVAE